MRDPAAKHPAVDLVAHVALAVVADWSAVAAALAADLDLVAAVVGLAVAVDSGRSVAGSDLAGHVAVDSGPVAERVADSDFAAETALAAAVVAVDSAAFCLAAEHVAVVPALVVVCCFAVAAACLVPVADYRVVLVVEVFPYLCFGPAARRHRNRPRDTRIPPLKFS